MDVVMAGTADDQGLALTCGHVGDPCRGWPSPLLLRVRELADMMNFECSMLRQISQVSARSR